MRIPESWDEISISRWRELKSIQSDNEATKLINQISILTDVDVEEIRQMPIKSFRDISDKVISFLSKPISNEVKTRFELNGKRYGIIPDMNFISTGEFVDMENFAKDSTSNIHLICATIWRPIVSETEDEWTIAPHTSTGFQKRADLFLNELPITMVWGGLVFFSSFVTEFLKITLDYLEEEEKSSNQVKKTKKTQRHTKKSN